MGALLDPGWTEHGASGPALEPRRRCSRRSRPSATRRPRGAVRRAAGPRRGAAAVAQPHGRGLVAAQLGLGAVRAGAGGSASTRARRRGPPCAVSRVAPHDRAWLDWALGQVEADANRSADTHLHVFPLPPEWGVSLYVKDESVHPTGSLKHRLARSLVLYGLCSGWIEEGTTLVEASSGSTAVSEAYFARLLGLPVRRGDAGDDRPGEVRADRVLRRPLPPRRRARARSTPRPSGWPPSAAGTTSTSSRTPSGPPTGGGTTTSPSRCSPSSAASRTPCPTGSSSAPARAARARPSAATCGYNQLPTSLCVVDPEGSAFWRSWSTGDAQRHRDRVPHRGHRPAAGRAELRARGRRPDGLRARRGLGRGDALGHRPGWGAWPAARPGRTSGAPASSSPSWWRRAGGAASSRCSATTAGATPTATTTTPGSPPAAGTSPGPTRVLDHFLATGTWDEDRSPG